MLVFYTTFHFSNQTYEDGLNYLRTNLLPAIGQHPEFHTLRLQRILHEVEDSNGRSVSMQFCVPDEAALRCWLEDVGDDLLQSVTDKYGTEVAYFSTLLEELALQ